MNDNIKVELEIFGSLRKSKKHRGPVTLELNTGSNVVDVLNKIYIPDNIPILVILNEKHSDCKAVLKNGDKLGLFSPVCGG